MRSNGCVFLRAGVNSERDSHSGAEFDEGAAIVSHSQRQSKKPVKIAVWDPSRDCPRNSSHSATREASQNRSLGSVCGRLPLHFLPRRKRSFARHETVVFPDVGLVFGVGCGWGISGSGNVMQPTQASCTRPTSAQLSTRAVQNTIAATEIHRREGCCPKIGTSGRPPQCPDYRSVRKIF